MNTPMLYDVELPDNSDFPINVLVNVIEAKDAFDALKYRLKISPSNLFDLDQLVHDIVACITLSASFEDNLLELISNYGYGLDTKEDEDLFRYVKNLIVKLGHCILNQFKALRLYSEDDVAYYDYVSLVGTILHIRRMIPSEHYSQIY